MDQKDQEAMLRASFYEQQAQQVREQIDILEREVQELEQFNENLATLDTSKEKQMLASLGKGIYVPATLADKTLFVEVGSSVIVKKTPQETQEVVKNQLKKLKDARLQLLSRLEFFVHSLKELIANVTHNHSHQGHDHTHEDHDHSHSHDHSHKH